MLFESWPAPTAGAGAQPALNDVGRFMGGSVEVRPAREDGQTVCSHPLQPTFLQDGGINLALGGRNIVLSESCLNLVNMWEVARSARSNPETGKLLGL